MNSPITTRLAALALCSVALAAPASATITSYQGTFAADDERFALDFDLAAGALLSVTTWSYAGGINAAGATISAGGFVPVLTLFEASQGLLQIARGSTQACGPGSSAADLVTGFCWDAALSGQFSAGHYRLVLTQDGNEPLGSFYDDGFSQDGASDFTGQLFAGQAGLRFVQVDGAQRDAHWAFDVSIGAVPEPHIATLLLAAAAAMALTRRPTRRTRTPL